MRPLGAGSTRPLRLSAPVSTGTSGCDYFQDCAGVAAIQIRDGLSGAASLLIVPVKQLIPGGRGNPSHLVWGLSPLSVLRLSKLTATSRSIPARAGTL